MEKQQERIIEQELQDFHPALDFKGNKAYLAVKEVIEIAGTKISKKYFVITSDRELIPLEQINLVQHGLFTEILKPHLEDRWSKGSVLRWKRSEEDFTLMEVFNDIKKLYESHLDYADKRLYTLLPLWIIGTYFFPLFNAYPIIFLNGASGSGKSKTGELAGPLSFNGKLMANISDSSLFRIIHLSRATLILDESEKIAIHGDHYSQLNYLLSGYKAGATVMRMKQEKDGGYVHEEFYIYSPKMIANIRGVRETALLNRAIRLVLTPSQAPQSKTVVDGKSPSLRVVRDKIYVYMMNHWEKVKKSKELVSQKELGFHGYDLSNWLPILTLANLLGKKPFAQMLEIAGEKIKENKELSAENDNYYRLFTVISKLEEDDAHKVVGRERFYLFETIYGRYLNEMGFEYDLASPAHPDFSKQTVGRMIEYLQIGKEARVLVGGRLTRGRWINNDRIRQTRERYGYPANI